MQQHLTAGAWRIIHHAATMAASGRASDVEPKHLLWALLLDESRASELMLARGFSQDQLALMHAPDFPLDRPAESDSEPKGLQSPFAELVVQEARRLSLELGRGQEAGSEHLLQGLALVAPDVAQLLEQLGIGGDDVTLASRQETPSTPIDVDVSIHVREGAETERHDALRIIDANANRAREGCRVVEDFVRFAMDDSHLARLLKNWRHQFTQTLLKIDQNALLAARETRGDVGTRISTIAESRRETTASVLKASLKRVQEATRTLEEYGKILSADLARDFEQLRYEFYTIERALLQTADARNRLADRRLYLLLTEKLCHHGSGPAVRAALAEGVDIVQLREKTMPDRAIVEMGRRIRKWCHEAGALFIMNDRPDLAVLTEADGVHVGQEELSVRDARRIIGPGKLVGVSTHTIEQAQQAVLDGADYIGIGPVFSTSTKQFSQLAGLDFIQAVSEEVTLPAFAIGGITTTNGASVLAAGATRLAVSSAICSAEDPATATRELLDLWETDSPTSPDNV